MKASVNLSHHRVSSGASGPQLVLLTSVSCSLSSLASLLPAVVVRQQTLQRGQTSVPKADSRSRGLACHLYTVTMQNIMLECCVITIPCLLQLHQESLYIPNSSPCTGHVFQIPAGDKAGDTVAVFSLGPPGLLRRALVGQVPTTTSEWLQTLQPGLETTLSSDFCHTCAVGWMVLVLGYFGQLNHNLFRARLL